MWSVSSWEERTRQCRPPRLLLYPHRMVHGLHRSPPSLLVCSCVRRHHMRSSAFFVCSTPLRSPVLTGALVFVVGHWVLSRSSSSDLLLFVVGRWVLSHSSSLAGPSRVRRRWLGLPAFRSASPVGSARVCHRRLPGPLRSPTRVMTWKPQRAIAPTSLNEGRGEVVGVFFLRKRG